MKPVRETLMVGCHKSATARHCVDQALAVQFAEGLAHRGAAEAELLTKLTFGGKGIAKLKQAIRNPG